jgi:hypothetical protein
MLGGFTSTIAYFGVYEGIKRASIEKGYDKTLTYLVAGGIGDIFAAIIYVPSEVIKTRLQLQGIYNNPHSLSGIR